MKCEVNLEKEEKFKKPGSTNIHHLPVWWEGTPHTG
jgi:hypothetical protein